MNNIEDFYNSIPWRVKEDAKFPTNFSSMNPEQHRLVKTIYDYESNNAINQKKIREVGYDTETIVEDAKMIVTSLTELCESLKKVAN